MSIDTLVDLLLYRSGELPTKTAYHFLDSKGNISSQYTYQEIDGFSRSIAGRISQSTKFGDRVGLIFSTCPEFIVSFFGCLYAGLVPVPINKPSKKNGIEHVKNIINDGQIKLCLTQILDVDWISSELPDYSVYSIDISDLEESSINPVLPVSSDIAFLQYTSGSTSLPKGTIITHKNVLSNQEMIRSIFNHTSESRVLGWTPLFHDMGLIGNMLQPLYVGCSVYLIDPTSIVLRPYIWFKIISDLRINTSGGPNFIYDHCVNRINDSRMEGIDLSTWKVAFNGAEPINPETIDKFIKRFSEYGFSKNTFLPCYGMAEATLIVSGVDYDSEPKSMKFKSLGEKKVVSCGKPSKGLLIEIVDQIGNVCKKEEVGEIVISGENVSKGYWNKDAKKSDDFIMVGGLSYFKTGDLGTIGMNGDLFVTGRKKELIIIDGRNIYPYDLEAVIFNGSRILRNNYCSVFQLEDEFKSIIAVQEVDRKYYSKLGRDDLIGIKMKLISKVNKMFDVNLKDIIFIEPNTIPQTSSGKIQRIKTKKLYINNELSYIPLSESLEVL